MADRVSAAQLPPTASFAPPFSDPPCTIQNASVHWTQVHWTAAGTVHQMIDSNRHLDKSRWRRRCAAADWSTSNKRSYIPFRRPKMVAQMKIWTSTRKRAHLTSSVSMQCPTRRYNVKVDLSSSLSLRFPLEESGWWQGNWSLDVTLRCVGRGGVEVEWCGISQVDRYVPEVHVASWSKHISSEQHYIKTLHNTSK